MRDIYHSTFVDDLIDASEAHPDENDPYWDEFWRLKSTTKQEPSEEGR